MEDDDPEIRLRLGGRFDQDLVDAIAAFQGDHDPPIQNRSEAVRRILRDWLIGHGYLPHDPEEGTRPEDLNATNDD